MADHLHLFEDPDREDAVMDELRRRQQAYDAAKARVTPEAATRAAQIHRDQPWVSPGVVSALATSGASPETVERVGRAEAARQESKQGFTRIGELLTGAVRTAFTAIESIAEEVVKRPIRAIAGASDRASEGGGFRPGQFFSELDDTYRLAGDSVGLVAIKQALRGEEVDLGTGFFPGGAAAAEAKRQAERLRIGEQPISVGRLAALAANDVTYYVSGHDLVQPGSGAYKVMSGMLDAAFTLGSDPTNALGGAFSKARKAAKTFEGTADLGFGVKAGRYVVAKGTADERIKFGLIGGKRETADPEAFIDHFLRATDKGTDLVATLREETDAINIWQSIKGMDRKTALRLAAADTDEAVIETIGDVLGTQIRELPKYKPRRLEDIRIFRDVPGGAISIENIDDGMRTLDDALVNVKVARETRYARLREMAELEDGDVAGVQQVVLRASADIDAALKARGVNSHVAKTMSNLFTDYAEEVRKYNIDEHGNNVPFPGSKKRVFDDGEEKVLATAHLLTEYMQRAVPLPDFRAQRHAASRLHQIEKMVPGVEGFSETIRTLNEVAIQDVWKPFVLLRGAWTVRVVGEEMIRLAAAGFDSPFFHPLSYIAYAVGRKGATDAVGNAIEDSNAFRAAMNRGNAGWRNRPNVRVVTGDFIDVGKEHPYFTDFWRMELAQLWQDPVARVVAAGRHSVGDVKDWFWSGAGKTYRHQLAEGGGPGKALLLDDAAARADGYESARDAANAYIDSVFRRIQVKTGGNEELIESIATRRLGDFNLESSNLERGKLRKALNERIDNAPERVKAPRDADVAIDMGRRDRLSRRYDHVVDAAFHVLMSRPSNFLSRAPVFKQSYWREVERLLHYTDEATKQTILENAAKAGFKQADLDRMAAIKGSGRISDEAMHATLAGVEDVEGFKTAADLIDEFAKAHGLRETKRLMYDLSRKNQFFDAARNILPFGEAWKEIWTTWGRLAYERPEILNIGRQVVEGGRYSGVLYEDEATGEETFRMPGGALLARTMGLGDTASFEVTGRAQGLNVATSSFLPGIGPTVAWAAAKFLGDAPDTEWIRSQIMPIAPSDADTAGGVIDANSPAWMKKVFQALTNGEIDEPAWNNTVAAIARHAIIEGKFTPAQWREALEWAAPKAKYMYAVNGVMQAFAPTAPKIQFVVEDKDGKFFQTQVAAREFAKMRRESGSYEEAVEEFVRTFGMEPWHVTQSRSRLLVQRATTGPGVRWERENEDLVKLLPHTVGLFAPDDPEAEYDFTAHRDQISRGERVRYTPQQQMRLANHAAASQKFRVATAQLGDRTDEAARLWKRQLYYALKEEHPGFDEISDVPRAVEIRLGQRHPWLDELVTAAGNPKIAKTEAGQGLVKMLAAREKAIEASAGLGLTAEIPFANADRAGYIRQWYRSVIDAVLQEHPEAAGVWDHVLSREIRAEEREGLTEQEAA